MPTVLRLGSWRIVIYPNDHRPTHVHVVGKDAEAVFNLHCPSGAPELRENYGFSGPQLTGIRNFLAENLDLLCAKWSEIHEDH